MTNNENLKTLGSESIPALLGGIRRLQSEADAWRVFLGIVEAGFSVSFRQGVFMLHEPLLAAPLKAGKSLKAMLGTL